MASINGCSIDAANYITGSANTSHVTYGDESIFDWRTIQHYDPATRKYHFGIDTAGLSADHGDLADTEPEKEEGDLCLCAKNLWS